MIDLCHSIFNVATIVGREQGDIKLKKNCKMFFTCLNSGKPEEYDALTDACIPNPEKHNIGKTRLSGSSCNSICYALNGVNS